jgi:hypothetical protein
MINSIDFSFQSIVNGLSSTTGLNVVQAAPEESNVAAGQSRSGIQFNLQL